MKYCVSFLPLVWKETYIKAASTTMEIMSPNDMRHKLKLKKILTKRTFGSGHLFLIEICHLKIKY